MSCMKITGHVVIFSMLVCSNFFLLLNRGKDDWPIADNIVTHSVRPFDAYNHVYKIFADDEGSFVNMLYSKEAHLNTWGNNRGLTDIQMLQYSIGCYPELLLQTDQTDVTYQLKSDHGDTGNVDVSTAAGATTINMKGPMLRVVANEDFVVINDEWMKVTGIDNAATPPTLTVQRATAPTGFKSVAAATLSENAKIERYAPEYGMLYPYAIQSLQGTDNPPTNGRISGTDDNGLDLHTRKSFKETPMSLCKCLSDVDKILNLHNAAADPANWRKTNVEANTKTTSSSSKGVHSDTRETDAGLRFSADLADTRQKNFKIRAVDSCVANYVGEYTQSYDGVLDARHLIDFAQFLLTLGAITIMVSSMYVFQGTSLKSVDDLFDPEKDPTDIQSYETLYVAFWHLATFAFGVTGFILNMVWDPHFDVCKGDDAKCNTQAELLNNRGGPLSWPDPLTISRVYHTTTGIVFLVVALLAAGRLFAIYFSQTGGAWAKIIDNKVTRRICIDLPYITGYAAMGMGLLAQSGVQDTISLVFTFALLFVVGFLQHVSNVSKLMYDALCRHTSSETMKKLFENDASAEYTNVRKTLQFFGWTRLFVFMTVLLASVSFLTMTREVIEANVVQSFMNGQLFYFILAFFWSNVGYDIARELVPFQFEKVHMDFSKLVVTLIYLTYFNFNLFWLHNAAAHSSEFNYSLHNMYEM